MDNETAYWRDVAHYLADVIAATASHQLGLSRVGAGERRRHKNIAQMAADALQGRNHPVSRKTEIVVKRLRDIVEST